MSKQNISSQEWRFVAVVSILLLIVTSIPYLFATMTVPTDRQFMGLLLNVPDHAQYLSWYKGFQSEFIIRNTLTPEPNPPLFFNLLWWTLGRTGLYTGLNYAIIYQIFRSLSIVFYLIILYAFLSYIFTRLEYRYLSFLLISLSSGFGWVLVLLKYTVTDGVLPFPLDLYIAEGNSFFNMLASPTFIEAAGFIIWTFMLLLKANQTQKLRYAVYAGLVAFFLGWQHTYDLWIIWSIPGVYIGVEFLLKRKIPWFWVKSLVIVGAMTWPPALYAVLLTSLNPIWDEILAQFANAGVYSPTLPHMFIFMGLLLILALVALILRARDGFSNTNRAELVLNHETFVVVWFLVGWALAYIPTDYQVHMINSWQVPMGILATVAVLKYILPAVEQKYPARQLRTALVVTLVGFVTLTNIYLWCWRFVELARYDYPYYLHKDEVAAIGWLEDNTAPDSIVLSSLILGQYIPGLSNRTAFLAHWAQTVDFFGKTDAVQEFFAEDTPDAVREEILKQYKVTHIIYGPLERKMGGYKPGRSPYLQLIYSSAQVEIYQVQPQQLESMAK